MLYNINVHKFCRLKLYSFQKNKYCYSFVSENEKVGKNGKENDKQDTVYLYILITGELQDSQEESRDPVNIGQE